MCDSNMLASWPVSVAVLWELISQFRNTVANRKVCHMSNAILSAVRASLAGTASARAPFLRDSLRLSWAGLRRQNRITSKLPYAWAVLCSKSTSLREHQRQFGRDSTSNSFCVKGAIDTLSKSVTLHSGCNMMKLIPSSPGDSHFRISHQCISWALSPSQWLGPHCNLSLGIAKTKELAFDIIIRKHKRIST